MVAGLVELCAPRRRSTPRQVDAVFHGTTVATNAVLEHRGAEAGMITTEGFRDIVHIGRHQRPQHYSIMQDIPWQARPVRRSAATARSSPSGSRRRAATCSSRSTRTRFEPQPAQLREAGVESVAVCFLFSYLNPAHERRAAEIVARRCPDAFVTSSADIFPQFREFERFTTACINAFVGPGDRPLPRAARARPRRRGRAGQAARDDVERRRRARRDGGAQRR